jgi:hypothetical protein
VRVFEEGSEVAKTLDHRICLAQESIEEINIAGLRDRELARKFD